MVGLHFASSDSDQRSAILAPPRSHEAEGLQSCKRLALLHFYSPAEFANCPVRWLLAPSMSLLVQILLLVTDAGVSQTFPECTYGPTVQTGK